MFVAQGMNHIGNQHINAYKNHIAYQNLFAKGKNIHLVDILHKHFQIVENIQAKQKQICNRAAYYRFQHLQSHIVTAKIVPHSNVFLFFMLLISSEFSH